jgi:ABC-type multidrug transport system fused ATPase/permease subunit
VKSAQLNILSKISSLLTPRERFQGGMLLIALVIMGLMDVASVVSIMPFIAILATPALAESNKWLHWTYSFFGFSNINAFIFFLGGIVMAALVINNTVKACILWYTTRFANICRHSMASRMLTSYLYKPYVFFLNRNTAELGKNVLSEVEKVIDGAFRPFMDIIAQGAITVFIVTMLLVVDPLLAISIAAILGLAYTLIYAIIRKKIAVIGELRNESNEGRFQAADDALSGIKEIKVLGQERSFLNRYSGHSERLASYHTTYQVAAQLPQFALEVIAVGGIMIIVLYLLYIKHSMAQALPMIALYAFSIKRLMPAFQVIFSSYTAMRFHMPILNILYRDMAETAEMKTGMAGTDLVTPLSFHSSLQLQSIYFTYPQAEEAVIQDIDLTIAARSMIAFVGATGSGKTTLMDIILGLLIPNQGCIKVDGEIIHNGNVRSWQRNIGYVPQFIYLSDNTMTRNIAFGVPDDEIDMMAVERAAKIANLHDFIVNELPQGYETAIGERGIRLSGGQRQRIGIARAMYHDPEVLILDEATSALDGITEDVVMEAINNLSRKKTIIMIAHRLTTVKDCDVIYVMDCGHIIAQGRYQDLLQNCDIFRAMAKMND